MAKIGLTVYAFSLNNEVFDLGNIRQGKSFVDLAYEFFSEQCAEYINNPLEEKIFKVRLIENDVYKIDTAIAFQALHGIAKSGSYGVESEIVDTENGEIQFVKHENHAEVMPFNFSILIVPGKSSGIIILETVSRYGITTLFKQRLETLVKNKIGENIIPILTNVAPHEYFQRLLNDDQLKSIRLIKYMDKPDIADQQALDPFESEIIEQVYRLPKSFDENRKNIFINGFKNRSAVNDIIGITNTTYDNIKLEFQVGKSTKIVNYSSFSSLTVSEDITDLVIIDKGHPIYTSIKKVIEKFGIYYLNGTHVLAPIKEQEKIEIDMKDFLDTNIESESGEEESAVVGV